MSETVTLWRATSDGYTGHGSWWAVSEDTGRAYLDNPGYGGASLVAAEVSIDETRVLDLTGPTTMGEREWAAVIEGAAEHRIVRRLVSEHGDARTIADEMRHTDYALVHDAVSALRSGLRESYDWIRVTDTYPDGAETWLYLGSAPVVAQEVQ